MTGNDQTAVLNHFARQTATDHKQPLNNTPRNQPAPYFIDSDIRHALQSSRRKIHSYLENPINRR